MTGRNLRAMYELADADDRREGLLAYGRYNEVLRGFAEHYGQPFDRTVAAFCALSPNNDYLGNLRSLASVLAGVSCGKPCDAITVSTYKHCRDRAYKYVTGDAVFETSVRGPKILSFYRNILDPTDRKYVTIDGHMKAAYVGERLTMKEAIIRAHKEYDRIADATKRLARSEGLLPNQIQATIWFARKRTQRIKYNAQLSLFGNPEDKWGTFVDVSDAPPYTLF